MTPGIDIPTDPADPRWVPGDMSGMWILGKDRIWRKLADQEPVVPSGKKTSAATNLPWPEQRRLAREYAEAQELRSQPEPQLHQPAVVQRAPRPISTWRFIVLVFVILAGLGMCTGGAKADAPAPTPTPSPTRTPAEDDPNRGLPHPRTIGADAGTCPGAWPETYKT